MSEEKTALVPVPQREIRVVQDVIPTLDTARFEHMQRIASVMAQSSLIPDALRTYKEGNDTLPLPLHAIVSNCFLVVNQAVRWELDPFAVAQCCSVVHGRLMYEGKLIAAVLESRLRIKLEYKFGKWDATRQATDLSEEGQGELLAVRVAEKDSDRFVDGFVGGWKTTGSNNPWQPANFRRQLRYRGTREWARAHEPAVVLGVYADDEFDEPRAETRRGRPDRVTAATAELSAPAAFSNNVPLADAQPLATSAASTPAAPQPNDTSSQSPVSRDDVFPGDRSSQDGEQPNLFGDGPQKDQVPDADGVLDDLDVITRDLVTRLGAAAGHMKSIGAVVAETEADFALLDEPRRQKVRAALESARNAKPKKVA